MREICGNCKYYERFYDGHSNQEFCCGNENGKYYAIPIMYDDTCDEWSDAE